MPSGRQAGVDVQQIESELRDLWRREAAAAESPMTRLRTLNLVVMAGEDSRDPLIQEVLATIPARHPSRVVVLAIDPAATGGIRTEVNIRSAEMAGPDRQVCSEEITLIATPDSARLLASSMLPILVQDLPTYLWWAAPGDPVGTLLFEDLSQSCDRTIVDSALAPAPGFRFLRGLAMHAAERGTHAFDDLNWNRLYEWRELTAQFFDHQDQRDALDQITAVEVAYEGPDGGAAGSCQALLYVAWLAARLGWRPTAARSRGTEREIWFDGTQGDVSARILASDGATDREGGLVAAQIVAGPETGPTQLVLRCSDDRSYIESIAELPLNTERRRITRYERPATAAMLLDELDSRHRDEVLEEVLLLLRSIPERVGG